MHSSTHHTYSSVPVEEESKRDRDPIPVGPIPDRYGFIMDERRPSILEASKIVVPSTSSVDKKALEKKRKKDLLRENIRMEKWRLMMVDWDRFRTRNFDLVKRRIRKGVPDCFRGAMWQGFAQSQALVRANPGVYKQMTEVEVAPWESDIMRDIARTFPKHVLFRDKNGLGQRSLLSVLRALSLYCPDVGYCQGMGFVTGLLLIYMGEEDSFWLMTSLMQNYGMEGLFKPGLPLLEKYFFQFDELIKFFFPKLHQHLARQGIDHSMYASQWFITVFTYNFPFDVVVRVWDIFLSEGIKIVFRVALAILKQYHDKLLECSFEDIIGVLKDVPFFIEADTIIPSALQIKLTTRKLKELEDRYNARQ
eukprot:GILI01013862.1.p1 GENE.GILI01013862.1~~GILI01013862.1.p1  ORF type:complete len:364 (-),score=76.76 GILI01013862.1:851-1942(-)